MNRSDILDGFYFYRSWQWQEARYRALLRAQGRCEDCGARAASGVRLDVHHLKPRRLYPELALTDDNLLVLCRHCHSAHHGKFAFWANAANEDEYRPEQLNLFAA